MKKVQLALGALLLGSVSLYSCASSIVAADNSNTVSAPHMPGAANAPAAQSAVQASSPTGTDGKEASTGTFSNAKTASPN